MKNGGLPKVAYLEMDFAFLVPKFFKLWKV